MRTVLKRWTLHCFRGDGWWVPPSSMSSQRHPRGNRAVHGEHVVSNKYVALIRSEKVESPWKVGRTMRGEHSDGVVWGGVLTAGDIESRLKRSGNVNVVNVLEVGAAPTRTGD
jgi:hypothetical protein